MMHSIAQLLKSDVAQFNEYRREHPNIHLNLNDSILTGVCLRGADLHRAHLICADLRGACLAGLAGEAVILRDALLGKCDLSGANLDRADLFRADLSCTDLSGATISGAFLLRTRLHGADLRTCSGLTQEQVDQAAGDMTTKLPAGLRYPIWWTRTHTERRRQAFVAAG